MGDADEMTGMAPRPGDGDGMAVSFLHAQVEGSPSERLPRGQHELSPRYVAQHQRVRILESMTHALHRVGYLDLTVADIVKGAHVSRRTFYEHFTDKRHCYVATFGAGVECLADAVRSAYCSEQVRDDGVAAAFSTLLGLVIEYPETGHTCLVQGGISGTEAERMRLAALRMCADGFGSMVRECEPVRDISALECELAVGSIAELLRARLVEGREQDLARDLPETVIALLSAVLGAERARAIAGRIQPPAALATERQRVAHP